MFISLLIPRPHALGRDIDIYLRPLIDELKELWVVDIDTYDASINCRFLMCCIIMDN